MYRFCTWFFRKPSENQARYQCALTCIRSFFFHFHFSSNSPSSHPHHLLFSTVDHLSSHPCPEMQFIQLVTFAFFNNNLIRTQISKAANRLHVYLGSTKLFITGQFSLFKTTKVKLRSARKHIILVKACNIAVMASENPTIQCHAHKVLPESEAIVVVNEHRMQVRRNPSHIQTPPLPTT